MSTSRVFWDVVHGWERKSELFINAWTGAVFPSPIQSQHLLTSSLCWQRGKTKVLKRLFRTVKKTPDLFASCVSPATLVFSGGGVWNGISIHSGPEEMPSVQPPINQPKWRNQWTFLTKLESSAFGLIPRQRKPIRLRLLTGFKMDLHWWLDPCRSLVNGRNRPINNEAQALARAGKYSCFHSKEHQCSFHTAQHRNHNPLSPERGGTRRIAMHPVQLLGDGRIYWYQRCSELE
jgi:hypothetical protein